MATKGNGIFLVYTGLDPKFDPVSTPPNARHTRKPLPISPEGWRSSGHSQTHRRGLSPNSGSSPDCA